MCLLSVWVPCLVSDSTSVFQVVKLRNKYFGECPEVLVLIAESQDANPSLSSLTARPAHPQFVSCCSWAPQCLHVRGKPFCSQGGGSEEGSGLRSHHTPQPRLLCFDFSHNLGLWNQILVERKERRRMALLKGLGKSQRTPATL